MKTPKRLFSVLVSGALVLSLTTLPSGAVQSSFSDISDQTTAVNADILRLMGVVDGTGGNYFNPGSILTRAQFCTMVINFVQQGDQVPIHNTRTIFSDVPGSHWARGYVNLAAITEVPVESGTRLMLGLGNGRFGPDREVTYQEAATLVLRILGYGEEFLKAKYEEIVDFSELGQFIEVPIRNYSSGMLARLAFSIATVVKPEILIVDEILSVGDAQFQEKSRKRMLELMGGGTTVLFVSHSIEQIREMCNRVVWLEQGRVQADGEAEEVCDKYAG